MSHCPHCLQPVVLSKEELVAALEAERMQHVPDPMPSQFQMSRRTMLAKRERKRFHDDKAAGLVRQVELVEQLRKKATLMKTLTGSAAA